MPDNTGEKHSDTRFRPGQSGNPRGRPKGARNKLGEDFISALHDAWIQHGRAALQQVATERPWDFLKLVASVIPRDAAPASDIDLDELSDEELRERFGQVVARLRRTH